MIIEESKPLGVYVALAYGPVLTTHNTPPQYSLPSLEASLREPGSEGKLLFRNLDFPHDELEQKKFSADLGKVVAELDVPRVCKDIIECSRLNFSKDYMLIYQKGKEYCFVLVHGIDENNTEVFMASGSEDYLEKVSEELFRVIRFFDGIDDSNLEWRDFLIELTTQCEVYRDRPGEFPNVPKA